LLIFCVLRRFNVILDKISMLFLFNQYTAFKCVIECGILYGII
jgi:hypothetical protein